MNLKEKIQYLVDRGVTITEFSRRVNCSKSTLGRWLRGETNLSKRLEKDLTQVLDDYLAEIKIIME